MSSTPERLLLVEDEVIIGLDLKDALYLATGIPIDLAHNLRMAERLVSENEYTHAVLDLNLGMGETSVSLGLTLTDQGTSVVFTSGYGPGERPEVAAYTLIEKPFATRDVIRALGLSAPDIRQTPKAAKQSNLTRIG